MAKKKARRHLNAQQKAQILKQHLQDNLPISELVDKNGVQPSLIYTWLRQMYANHTCQLRAES